MKKLFIALGLVLALTGGGVSQQSVTPKGAKSDATLLKIRQIDMLVQILPLAIKKTQFEPILASLDRAREKQKKTLLMEDDFLEKIDAELGEAVKNGLEKGTFPPHDLQVKAAKLWHALSINRQVATNEMVQDLYTTFKGDATHTGVFDEGQLKVMANSLDAQAFDPSVKKDSMNEVAKIKFFITQIFLDPVTYDLLRKLAVVG